MANGGFNREASGTEETLREKEETRRLLRCVRRPNSEQTAYFAASGGISIYQRRRADERVVVGRRGGGEGGVININSRAD